MPELPDVTLYLEALASPFLLRTVDPPLAAAHGRHARRLRRLGKRIALGLDGDLWLVIHLMINGRLHWKEPNAKLAGRKIKHLVTQ